MNSSSIHFKEFHLLIFFEHLKMHVFVETSDKNSERLCRCSKEIER